MDVMTETSKRIEELERENKELNEKLDKCRKLLRIAVENIEYVEREFGCAGCTGDWKNCPFNEGEKDVCAEHWIHADEVREVLKDEN